MARLLHYGIGCLGTTWRVAVLAIAAAEEAIGVESREFDQLVRTMATGVSRRSVLRRAVGSAIASPAGLLGIRAAAADGKDNDKDKDKDKNKGKDNNRGNVDVSGGVASARAGQTVTTANQVCAGNCDQTTQQAVGGPISQTAIAGSQGLFGLPPTYFVDASCIFDAALYQTTCICTGRGAPDAPRIRKITLPAADICAFLISEEVRPEGERITNVSTAPSGGQASAGDGGVANADASGGAVSIGDISGDSNAVNVDASGGTANADASGGDNNVAIAGGGQVVQTDVAQLVELSTLTLTLEGQVVPGRQTTYWLDTDAGLRPANGPALVQVPDERADVGAIVAEAWACGIAEPRPGYDWFGQCTVPVTDMTFSLYPESGDTAPLATAVTNAQGRARFGNLAPGTYQLQPGAALGSPGAIWCYAESDRVDANGNIMVEGDVESHVWSFVCGTPAGS